MVLCYTLNKNWGDDIMFDKSHVFTDGVQHEFVLMNKNEPLVEFTVDEKFDTFKLDKKVGKLPSWVSKVETFVRNRKAPKHRENIQELLKLSGCATLLGWLRVSHALSLIDTFWVKPKGSDMRWEDVSLYTHDFNEVIAKTAFEGGLHGRNLSTTSPEYGTDGSFAKCWVREDGQIKMLKRGSSGARNAGLEPYSEFYAGQVIREFTKDYVPYDLRSMSGRMCSTCPIFTSEKFGYLPYAAVDKGNTSVDTVLETMRKYGLEDEAKRMFVIDSVILNEDRHTNNFGFLVDNDTYEIVGMAPLFDHNLSLLPYAEEDQFVDIQTYVDSKGPRLDEDWVRVAARCLTPETRKTLIRLQDFEFEKHPKHNLPDWRLEQLSGLVRKMAKDILEF